MAPVFAQEVFEQFDFFSHLRSDSPFLEFADEHILYTPSSSIATTPSLSLTTEFLPLSPFAIMAIDIPHDPLDMLAVPPRERSSVDSLLNTKRLDTMDGIPTEHRTFQPLIKQATGRKRRKALDMSDEPPLRNNHGNQSGAGAHSSQ